MHEKVLGNSTGDTDKFGRTEFRLVITGPASRASVDLRRNWKVFYGNRKLIGWGRHFFSPKGYDVTRAYLRGPLVNIFCKWDNDHGISADRGKASVNLEQRSISLCGISRGGAHRMRQLTFGNGNADNRFNIHVGTRICNKYFPSIPRERARTLRCEKVPRRETTGYTQR